MALAAMHCGVAGCRNPGELHPMILVLAEGVPASLGYGPARILLDSVTVCLPCAKTIDRRDFNDDDTWRAIVRIMDAARQLEPDRASLQVGWTRRGSDAALTYFDASEYAPGPYQGWPPKAPIAPPQRRAPR